MGKKFLEAGRVNRAAIFMSGSGTNAEKLLESMESMDTTWIPAAIVTDAPETSRAKEIAKSYDIPLIALDIKSFYRERGESRVSLKTEAGREIRGLWTDALRRELSEFNIDFGVLAGFIPLTNITADFPCLNVHPGDLTVEKDGSRLLVGLHTVPIEIAILEGYDHLRSSVIIAQTYTGLGGEMDSGPILGVSPEVPIDLRGKTIDQLREIASRRPSKRPVGGFKDELEQIASFNQNLLKENGDWVVFPPVVADFAAGKYSLDEQGTLLYERAGESKPVKTVVFGKGKDPIPLPV